MATWPGLGALALEHVRAAPGLTALRLSGVLAAVVLACAVSLYAGAVGDQTLQASLSPTGADLLITVSSQPDESNPLTPARYRAFESYLRHEAAATLSIPLRSSLAHLETVQGIPLYRAARGALVGSALGQAGLEYYAGVAAHISVLAGRLPRATGARIAGQGPVPVLLTRDVAASLGAHVGDRLALQPSGSPPRAVVVVGVYRVRNPLDAFWGSSELGPLVSPLLVPNAALFQALAGALPGSQPLYSWTLSIDPRLVRQDAADRLNEGLTAFTSQVTRRLPNATVAQAISAGLASFAAGFPLLVALLYALAAPALLVVLAYTVIVNALVLEQHRDEIVLLRGRGASHTQVAVSYLADGLLIAALAMAGGPWLSVPVAQAIGQTSGFLAFAAGRPFAVGVDAATFATAAVAGMLGLAAGLLPLASTARLRAAALATQRSRGRGRPGWQRRWVDVILLAIGVYTAIVLARRGAVTVSHEQDVLAEDPMIALGPLACLAGGALLSVRLLPLLSSALARTVAARSVSVGLGLRRIACEPLDYTRLAGLLTLILSSGAFAAAVAGTVAGNLADQARYAAGSPLRVIEYDPRMRVDAALPVQWHRRLAGVVAASPALRVQPDQAAASAGANSVPAEVLGIDPRTLGQVLWFRPDFATQSRDTLLGLLSAARPRVLASQGLLESLHVAQGDTVTLSLQGQADVPVSIVGVVRYFPTLDPATGPFLVANLAFLQRAAGAVAPSEEWLRPSDGGSGPATASILAALRRAGRIVVDFEARPPALSLVGQPLQVGLFGIGSAGLLIGAALCLAGLVAETFFSLRRRSSEFGVLRALGSTPGAVSLTLLVERTIVVVMATLSALAIGLLMARLFIPYLPVVTSATPPFLVTIAWSDVAHLLMVVAAAFLATLAATLWIVRHLEVHRTIRLGD